MTGDWCRVFGLFYNRLLRKYPVERIHQTTNKSIQTEKAASPDSHDKKRSNPRLARWSATPRPGKERAGSGRAREREREEEIGRCGGGRTRASARHPGQAAGKGARAPSRTDPAIEGSFVAAIRLLPTRTSSTEIPYFSKCVRTPSEHERETERRRGDPPTGRTSLP